MRVGCELQTCSQTSPVRAFLRPSFRVSSPSSQAFSFLQKVSEQTDSDLEGHYLDRGLKKLIFSYFIKLFFFDRTKGGPRGGQNQIN